MLSLIFVIPTTLLISWLFLDIGKGDGKLIESVNSIVVLWTFIALVYYAISTEQTKNQIASQNEFLRRPLINLYPGKDGQGARFFKLRNVSSVTAYNITIEPINLENVLHQFYLDPSQKILEGGGDTKALKLFSSDKRSFIAQSTDDFLLVLTKVNPPPPHQGLEQRRSVVFSINFRNLAGNRYHAIFKVYPVLHHTNEMVVDFIASGTGEVSYGNALRVAEERPIQESVYDRAVNNLHGS